MTVNYLSNQSCRWPAMVDSECRETKEVVRNNSKPDSELADAVLNDIKIAIGRP